MWSLRKSSIYSGDPAPGWGDEFVVEYPKHGDTSRDLGGRDGSETVREYDYRRGQVVLHIFEDVIENGVKIRASPSARLYA